MNQINHAIRVISVFAAATAVILLLVFQLG
jgi:hypothetical protein